MPYPLDLVSMYVVGVYLLIYLWMEGFHPNSVEGSKASKGTGFQYMPQM